MGGNSESRPVEPSPRVSDSAVSPRTTTARDYTIVSPTAGRESAVHVGSTSYTSQTHVVGARGRGSTGAGACTSFHYVARGGGRVEVPNSVKPHEVLGITTDATETETKVVFRRGINRTRRQQRVMASLAYHMLTSSANDNRYIRNGDVFKLNKTDVFMLAAIGHTNQLLREIARNKSLIDRVDSRGRTVLYLVARCGFYDTTEALLKGGATVNKVQADGSTPLHGAAFYGQASIVKLLLVYGADPKVKNKWGNTPADEVASEEIRQILDSHKKDHVSSVTSSLVSQGLAARVRLIYRGEKVIGKEIVRNRDTLDSQTRQRWDDIHSSWERAWHGTKADYLESIIRNGLMPSGTRLSDGKTIRPPRNHYQLSEEHFGIANWAKAIFLSPSIFYASHACYSERVISEGEQWCVLVKARVKPTSYKSYDPTVVFTKDPIDGEPDTPEYRVPVRSELD